MITIRETTRCFWRNRYGAEPGLQAILVSSNSALGAPVPADVLRILTARWPELVDIENSAVCLIAALIDALRQGQGAPSTLHDASNTAATIFVPERDAATAEAALRAAVRIVSPHRPQNMTRTIDEAAAAVSRVAFDQTTRAMISEAERRDVPWIRLTRLSRHVRIGQGAHQHIIRESMPGVESSIGREIARRKVLTLAVLQQIGLPSGRFAPVETAEEALQVAQQIGYPVVLKPSEGEKGRDVHAGLRNATELRAAIAQLRGLAGFLVQSHFAGDDHRLLVVDGKLVAAAKRVPASVVGDGVHTVAQLVEETNRDERRGSGKLMDTIVLDARSDQVLARSGFTRSSVPKKGETVGVKATANVSTGGTAVDIAGIIHPDNARAAIKAAKALGLKVAGVDFISPDILRSWREVGGGICEVNTLVGIRPHWLANPEQNVIAPIFDMFVAPGDDLRIPTAMIAGTNCTMATFMLADILTAAGHAVGVVTSHGVTVDGEQIANGDYTGYRGADLVMRDPTVTAAVLETGRSGLIKHGTYLDRCDVGALLNIGHEQRGAEMAEDIAIARKVLNAARKAVVLSADDALCAGMLAEFRGAVRVIAFSADAGSKAVEAHVKAGGEAIAVSGKDIIRILPGRSETLMSVSSGGVLGQNISSALAAIGLALGMDIDVAQIRSVITCRNADAGKPT